MNNTVFICDNAADPETWEKFEHVENVCELLLTQYGGAFPDNARVYHGLPSLTNDVTPGGDAATIQQHVKRLLSLQGEFYVITYPEFFLFGILGGGIIGTIIKIFLVGALMMLLAPKPPKPRHQRAVSPNNALTERKNEPRVNERIPDIFGQVRSTPDLIAVSYSVFENHQQVETSYMAIGRGEYETDDIKDDTTLISDIAGTTIAIYAPFTSPNSGDDPEKLIGKAIDDPLLAARRSNSVNGQVLKAPNLNEVKGGGPNNIIFKYPNIIEVLENTDVNFTDYFSKGDNLSVTGSGFTGPADAPFPGGTVNFNISPPGYEIFSVEANFITLVNPQHLVADWDNLPIYFRSGETDATGADLTTDSEKWVGPFLLDVSTLTRVFMNFVAVGGLYKDNGTKQTKEDVDLEAEIEPFNIAGDSIGDPELFTVTVFGSKVSRSQRAASLKAIPTFTGRCKVRCRRTTDTKDSFDGQVVDEIKWQDVYAISEVTQNDFGDITSIHALTIANAGALTIKERKLNMLATRKIHTRGDITTTRVGSIRVDDIFTAMCIDPKIGNRDVTEIDVDGIYDIVAEIEAYFGISKAIEFGATFDDKQVSFEELITSVADTMFCKVYRVGNVLKITFEKQRIDSNLLFNHRNKIPGTEKRSIRFGLLDENDGIEFEYVDGETEDDAAIRFFIPEDQSAINPKVIESVGVRTKILARFHAYRLWNKLVYQNVGVEFEATSEAALLNINDRIIVADNTRDNTQDGEVISQSGLFIELSQPVTFEAGWDYTIFLQLSDRTLQSMPVNVGSHNREVLLSQAPQQTLLFGDDAYVKTLYQIIKNTSQRQHLFLIKEREIKDKATFNVQGVNYDDRYYQNDLDFVDGVVDTLGEII